jgi:hypothetical protein
VSISKWLRRENRSETHAGSPSRRKDALAACAATRCIGGARIVDMVRTAVERLKEEGRGRNAVDRLRVFHGFVFKPEVAGSS